MVRRAKSFKNPFKISKIPSGYRLWASVGILFALLVALPITLLGFMTGTFELRKRAVTGEPTPTLGPGQVRILASISFHSPPFDQKGTISLHINNDSSNHINLIQLFLTFDPRIIDFEGSDVELWLDGEATVKEVYDAGDKKQLRLIYPVDFSGGRSTIGLIRYTPVSVGTSGLVFENDLLTGTLENKVTAVGSEDNLIVEIRNGSVTIGSGDPPFVNAAKFDNPYEIYTGYLKTQCIKTEESPSLNARQQMTIEAWIKLADIEPIEDWVIIAKKRAGDQFGFGSYVLSVNANKRLKFSSPYISVPVSPGVTTNSLESNEILMPGRWYHVAVEIYNPGVQMYINGRYDNGGRDYGQFPQEDLVSKVSIGGDLGQDDLPGYLFNGEIDEVRLSNIIRNWSGFSIPSRPFVADSYTMALWHLDEYTGSQYVVDSSPNLNSGIIIGDVLFVPSGVESAVPTPTPTITPTPTLVPTPTPTPTPATQTLQFKLKFEGVTSRPSDDTDKQVQIYATSYDGGAPIGSADSKETVTLSVDDSGIYHGEITLTSAFGYFGYYYRLRVKGPKHLQAVFPDVVFQEGVELDLTGQTLRPGDLNLDSRVDKSDLQLINDRMFSTDPADVALADVNFDNRVDIIDRTLVLNTLSVYYDPD